MPFGGERQLRDRSSTAGDVEGAPTRLETRAVVTFQPGRGITGIHLMVEGEVPGIDNATFVSAANDAKKNCPVSQALAGTTITLDAKLI